MGSLATARLLPSYTVFIGDRITEPIREDKVSELQLSPPRVLTFAEFGVACGSRAGFSGKGTKGGCQMAQQTAVALGRSCPGALASSGRQIQALDP